MELVPPYADSLWEEAAKMTAEERQMHAQTFKELHALNLSLNGAGLSFPQVGIRLTAFVSRYEGWKTCVNPEYRVTSENHSSRLEGCLSKPGWHIYVRRPVEIYARWDNEDGFYQTAKLEGIEARVFLHLFDLCHGMPIFPRPKAPKQPCA